MAKWAFGGCGKTSKDYLKRKGTSTVSFPEDEEKEIRRNAESYEKEQERLKRDAEYRKAEEERKKEAERMYAELLRNKNLEQEHKRQEAWRKNQAKVTQELRNSYKK